MKITLQQLDDGGKEYRIIEMTDATSKKLHNGSIVYLGNIIPIRTVEALCSILGTTVTIRAAPLTVEHFLARKIKARSK